MSRRIAATAVLLVVVATALTASAAARTPARAAAAEARLNGAFKMIGKVTVAKNVRGEHAGELVTRTWTFTALCSTGPCASVQLVRGRATGTDTLTLEQTAPGTYGGVGLFYAPLRCSGRIYPRGQEIPFRINVRITATAGPDASAISASYVNRERTNRTPCIGVLGHDSARYTGQLSGG